MRNVELLVPHAGPQLEVLRVRRWAVGANPLNGVGNNLKRHATLRANAVKEKAKSFGTFSPLGDWSRRESTGFGQPVGSEPVG